MSASTLKSFKGSFCKLLHIWEIYFSLCQKHLSAVHCVLWPMFNEEELLGAL